MPEPTLPTIEIKRWCFAVKDGSTVRLVLPQLIPGLRVLGFNISDADDLPIQGVTVRSGVVTRLERNHVIFPDRIYVLKGDSHPAYRAWCLKNGLIISDADPAGGSIPLVQAELAE